MTGADFIHIPKYSHMCVTDLDETLLNAEHQISEPNLLALHKLGERGICRVAATGRSLFAVRKVIAETAPFDYIIFSTGAGIINWHTKTIILSRLIEQSYIEHTFKQLEKLKLDFMFHAPIPENHRFVAVRSAGLPDFERRISYYEEYCVPLLNGKNLPWQEGTQFLAIAEAGAEYLCPLLTDLLKPLHVVRTTSPLDHQSLWLEIFAPDVSKGSAVTFLRETLGVQTDCLMVAGNDYNDEDMLHLTRHAYVTSNSPAELRSQFQVVSDYNEHGFSEAVDAWLSGF